MVALDEDLRDYCKERGIPHYFRPVKIPDTQKDTGSNHAISAMKYEIIYEFLQLGWDVLLRWVGGRAGRCGGMPWVVLSRAGPIVYAPAKRPSPASPPLPMLRLLLFAGGDSASMSNFVVGSSYTCMAL